ncbi:MAG: hypothetical protein H6618_07030 [Deltaproteobacteria bacterium]|nr:hypothetical protein [Deltaproteobacteria bacterium]
MKASGILLIVLLVGQLISCGQNAQPGSYQLSYSSPDEDTYGANGYSQTGDSDSFDTSLSLSSLSTGSSATDHQNDSGEIFRPSSVLNSVSLTQAPAKSVDLAKYGDIFLNSFSTEIVSAGPAVFITASSNLKSNQYAIGQSETILPVRVSEETQNKNQDASSYKRALNDCQFLLMYHIEFTDINSSSYGYVLLDLENKTNGVFGANLSLRSATVHYFGDGYYQIAKNCGEERIRSSKSMLLSRKPTEIQKSSQEALSPYANIHAIQDSEIKSGTDPLISEAVHSTKKKLNSDITEVQRRISRIQKDTSEQQQPDKETDQSSENDKKNLKHYQETESKLQTALLKLSIQDGVTLPDSQRND